MLPETELKISSGKSAQQSNDNNIAESYKVSKEHVEKIKPKARLMQIGKKVQKKTQREFF